MLITEWIYSWIIDAAAVSVQIKQVSHIILYFINVFVQNTNIKQN